MKYAGAAGFSLDKLQMKDNGSMVVETSLSNAVEGCKFIFKGDDSQKGDLSVEYTVGMLGLTAEMDINEQKKVSGAAARQRRTANCKLRRAPRELVSTLGPIREASDESRTGITAITGLLATCYFGYL